MLMIHRPEQMSIDTGLPAQTCGIGHCWQTQRSRDQLVQRLPQYYKTFGTSAAVVCLGIWVCVRARTRARAHPQVHAHAGSITCHGACANAQPKAYAHAHTRARTHTHIAHAHAHAHASTDRQTDRQRPRGVSQKQKQTSTDVPRLMPCTARSDSKAKHWFPVWRNNGLNFRHTKPQCMGR